MKRNNWLLIVLIFLTSLISSHAQDKKFGFGVMLGEPTGFSAKYWLSEKNALDFGLAYSFIGNDNGFSLHCDYVYHLASISRSTIQLPVYYGFGAQIRAVNHSKSFLGARGVIGLLYMDSKLPIDAFIELAPVFYLFPETSLHFDLALGARYYFE